MPTQGVSQPTMRATDPKLEPRVEREVDSVTVTSRIPEFWADQPRLWFVQFEAVLDNQKLSDAAKSNLVVTKLNKSAIQQISDVGD